MEMVPQNKSIWSTGGAILYLVCYAAILVYSASLWVGILISMFILPETFEDLGRFLARVTTRRNKQS